MRAVLRAVAVASILVPVHAFAADEKLLVELNTIENTDNRCRLNFVIENKSSTPLESMKLDLVVFGTDGGIMRRLITEMAPVRPAGARGRGSRTPTSGSFGGASGTGV